MDSVLFPSWEEVTRREVPIFEYKEWGVGLNDRISVFPSLDIKISEYIENKCVKIVDAMSHCFRGREISEAIIDEMRHNMRLLCSIARNAIEVRDYTNLHYLFDLHGEHLDLYRNTGSDSMRSITIAGSQAMIMLIKLPIDWRQFL